MEGNCYFIVIIDDNTGNVWTYDVASKDIFFPVFKLWETSVDIETNLKLSNLQINGRDEYVGLAL